MARWTSPVGRRGTHGPLRRGHRARRRRPRRGRRRGDGLDRSERSRQDHAVRCRVRVAGDRPRPDPARRHRHHQGEAVEAGPDGHRPHLPAVGAVRLDVGARQHPGRRRGAPVLRRAARERRGAPTPTSEPRRSSTRSACDPSPTSGSTCSRPAWPGWWRSVGRWPDSRRCCCSTSRPPGLSEDETDAFASLLDDLAADGLGILLVEHDVELVMRVCHRIHVLDFGQRDRGRHARRGAERRAGARRVPGRGYRLTALGLRRPRGRPPASWWCRRTPRPSPARRPWWCGSGSCGSRSAPPASPPAPWAGSSPSCGWRRR